MQGFASLLPPTNFGVIGTVPLWYHNASRIFQKMDEDAANPNGKFMLVGHSYGGATALIVAARLLAADDTRTVSVLTFGSPKPGGLSLRRLLGNAAILTLVNDTDLVGAVPPNFQVFWPLLDFTSFFAMNVWDLWRRPPNRARMDAAGVLTFNQDPILDFETLSAMLFEIINHLPFDQILTHGIEFYRTRILTRCPLAEWPISPWLLLFLQSAGGDLGLRADIPAVAELVWAGDTPADGDLVVAANLPAAGDLGLTGQIAIRADGDLVLGGDTPADGDLIFEAATPITGGPTCDSIYTPVIAYDTVYAIYLTGRIQFFQLPIPLPPIGTQYTITDSGHIFGDSTQAFQGVCAGPLHEIHIHMIDGVYSFNTLFGYANVIHLAFDWPPPGFPHWVFFKITTP